MKKRIVFALLLIMFLAACQSSVQTTATTSETVTVQETTGEEVFKVQEKILHTRISRVPNLDPAKKIDMEDRWILNHLYTGLITYNQDGVLQEGIAKLPKISDDGKTVRFTIKTDAVWNNGDPLTAEDFKRGLMRLFEEDGQWNKIQFIEGVEEYATMVDLKNWTEEDRNKFLQDTGKENYEKSLAEAKEKLGFKIEGNQLIFQLNHPLPNVLEQFSDPAFYPCHESMLNSAFKLNENYISNGIFEGDSSMENEIILKKCHQDADSLLHKISFQIIQDDAQALASYESENLDVLIQPLSYAINEHLNQQSPDLQIEQDLGVAFLRINMDKDLLKNKTLRRALAFSIPHESLWKNFCYDAQAPATALIPYGFKTKEGVDFREQGNFLWDSEEDSVESLNIFNKALEEEQQTAKNIQLNLLIESNHQMSEIAKYILQQWKKILGIDVTLLEVDPNKKMQLESIGAFDLSLDFLYADYTNPLSILETLRVNHKKNYGHYYNEDFEKTIAPVYFMKQDEAWSTMHEAEQILMSDMPIIPLYFTARSSFVKPHITGIIYTALSYPLFFNTSLGQ